MAVQRIWFRKSRRIPVMAKLPRTATTPVMTIQVEMIVIEENILFDFVDSLQVSDL